MPLCSTPQGVPYYLVDFDAIGDECDDDQAVDGSGLFSSVVIEDLRKGDYTDVFIVSHGWRGDRLDAVRQYDLWIDAMHKVSPNEIGRKSMIVGLHWPSEPFGDEGEGSLYFHAKKSATGVRDVVDSWTKRLGVATNKFVGALEEVCSHALNDEPPGKINKIRDAYTALDSELQSELHFGSGGNKPANDRLPFNPQIMTDLALQEHNALARSEKKEIQQLAVWNGMLLPLRILSVWTMKARAAMVGENGPRKFLTELQAVVSEKNTRFHLAGHSFGTIVVSSMAFGNNDAFPVGPLSSVVLIQGAVSHWSYAKEIPYRQEVSGYFYDGYKQSGLKGPLVTTQSSLDRANCILYRLAAAAAQQIAMAAGELAPQYGAIGQFGIWDGKVAATSSNVLATGESYNFAPGRIYNVDCSGVIKNGGGFSGAHNDIAHDEVAHLVWQSALALR
jgi:hypothetical protein